MILGELTLRDLRCIEQAELSLHPGHNLIWGGNGSGKTSLLEGIFLLGRGRSFRTRNSERLVRHGQERLVVFGRTESSGPESTGFVHAVGVEVDRKEGTRARIDAAPVGSLADLSHVFPVQVIDPEIHKLIEEGGRRRRRWLDWAVFHVEPRFADWWVRYGRAVRQRNAALRERSGSVRAWDVEVAAQGERISEARRNVVEQMQPYWREVVAGLDCPVGELQYFRGWGAQHSLAEALEASRTRDELRGLTHSGPHRADVLIRVGGRLAREVLSRGQQKLMAVALTLAQLRLLKGMSGTTPTLLLDDPAAELDADHLGYFVREIAPLGCQLVITSLHPETQAFGTADRVFHVEQGRVGRYNVPS
ncbi:MAG TPA: DNA replication/repair protein RecF [Steroidobacteraceae bacterium]|jgi:DNA replication and repair protein RecF|nr:DNA replication/repair protein RecF [Steroidobacteraceae bacterium]